MHTHEDFQSAMRANPEDRHVRGVYADFLDETGDPVHAEAARRLREHQAFRAEAENPPAASGARPDFKKVPGYAQRLHAIDQTRHALHGTLEPGHAEHADAFLHHAELHALGLGSPPSTHNVPHGFPVQAHQALDHLAHSNPEYAIHAPAMALSHREDVRPTFHPDGRQTADPLQSHFDRQNALLNAKHAPVKLSRLVDWIKRTVRGAPTPAGRKPGDGIVHTTADNPEGAKNELVALHAALMGLSRKHLSQADQYLRHAAGIVRDEPDSQIVKNYVEAAKTAKEPGPLIPHIRTILQKANYQQVQAKGPSEGFYMPPKPKHPLESAPPPAPPPAPPFDPGEWELVPEGESEPIPMAAKVPGPKVPKEAQEDLLEAFAHGGETPREKYEAAVQWLKTNHGFTNRSEAYAALRAAANRLKVKLGGRAHRGPQKLAAYGGKGAIETKHITGDTARRAGGAKVPFHDRIEGTSLAYNLRKIQRDHPELAEHAERAISSLPLKPQDIRDTSGTPGDMDPYAHIGRVLQAKGDPLANAHDWANMYENHTLDRHVEDSIKKHVRFNPKNAFDTPEEHTWQMWEGVRARVGADGHGGSAPGVAELRRRMIADIRKAGGAKKDESDDSVWERIKKSIHRNREDALDRYYLRAEPPVGRAGHAEWRKSMEAARRLSRGASPAQVQALAYKMWRQS